MPVRVFAQTPPWIQAGFQAGLHDYFIGLQKKPEFHKFDIHIIPNWKALSFKYSMSQRIEKKKDNDLD